MVLLLLAVSLNAVAEDQYLMLGYSNYTGMATTDWPDGTSFNKDSATILGFSTSLYDKYNIGLIADLNEGLQELDNVVLIFGTESGRIRVKNSTISGTLNNVAFSYANDSITWYQPAGLGVTYASYTTLGQHGDNPAGSWTFFKMDVTKIGVIKVADLFDEGYNEHNGAERKGWEADGDIGFYYYDFSAPDAGLSSSQTLGFAFNGRYGYFAKFNVNGSSAAKVKSGLFAGLVMEMDMTLEFLSSGYQTPMRLGPSVQYNISW